MKKKYVTIGVCLVLLLAGGALWFHYRNLQEHPDPAAHERAADAEISAQNASGRMDSAQNALDVENNAEEKTNPHAPLDPVADLVYPPVKCMYLSDAESDAYQRGETLLAVQWESGAAYAYDSVYSYSNYYCDLSAEGLVAARDFVRQVCAAHDEVGEAADVEERYTLILEEESGAKHWYPLEQQEFAACYDRLSADMLDVVQARRTQALARIEAQLTQRQKAYLPVLEMYMLVGDRTYGCFGDAVGMAWDWNEEERWLAHFGIRCPEKQKAAFAGRDHDLLSVTNSLLEVVLAGAEGFGYLLRDLDGDGMEELLLSYQYGGESQTFYALFTVEEDDQVTLLYSGWARFSLQIGADGFLYACGSGSAASGVYEKYSLQDHALQIQSELKYDYWSENYFFYNPNGFLPQDAGKKAYAITADRVKEIDRSYREQFLEFPLQALMPDGA
ncbi:MAG: hypothetical protein IJ747_02385 [Lachnospiraceae bacterium]|nr:hypothetical protein [Lachnospiraceae bacterium]